VPHESLVAEILLQNLAEEHNEPVVLRYTLGQGQIGIIALMEGLVVHAAQFNVPARRTFDDLGGLTIPETKWNGRAALFSEPPTSYTPRSPARGRRTPRNR